MKKCMKFRDLEIHWIFANFYKIYVSNDHEYAKCFPFQGCCCDVIVCAIDEKRFPRLRVANTCYCKVILFSSLFIQDAEKKALANETEGQ